MFASFNPKIDDTKDFIDKAINSEKGHLAVKIWRKAVDLSPVYTGSYRASWTISIGSLSFMYNNSGSTPNSVPSPTAPIFTVAGEAMDKVFVTNGAPYSHLVEYGGPNNPAHHVAFRAVSASI